MNLSALDFIYGDNQLPKIDLHNAEDITSALEQLGHELFLYYKKNEKLIRIIHGIGRGILKEKVLEFLANNPLVEDWQSEEAGGSTIAKLSS